MGNKFLSYKIFDCRIIDLPKIHHSSGDLTAINGNIEIPFSIARTYYTYNIQKGAFRGGHAHKELVEVVIALSGSFDLILDDGESNITIKLNKPDQGILLRQGIWRELTNFSDGAICLVLADKEYDEMDYIRNYQDFLLLKND